MTQCLIFDLDQYAIKTAHMLSTNFQSKYLQFFFYTKAEVTTDRLDQKHYLPTYAGESKFLFSCNDFHVESIFVHE